MSFTIQYGPSSVELRNAEYGDSLAYDDLRSLSRNRSGGALISVVDERGQLYRYEWTFINIKDTEKDALTALLAGHAGETVEVTDHAGDIVGYVEDTRITMSEERSGRWVFSLKVLSRFNRNDLPFILLEDSTYLLLEDGQKTLLESAL